MKDPFSLRWLQLLEFGWQNNLKYMGIMYVSWRIHRALQIWATYDIMLRSYAYGHLKKTSKTMFYKLPSTRHEAHARQKRRCANDPCLFELYLFWINKAIYDACLSMKWRQKEATKAKVPSMINKHCFLFPLSPFFATAVFTRVPFFDRKAKGLKELDRFCLMCT